MAYRLEEIIDFCEKGHGVLFKDRTTLINFLRMQLINHKDYRSNSKNNYFYFEILADKLLLFSYLIGKTSIVLGRGDDVRLCKIESIQDFYLLKSAEPRFILDRSQVDPALANLFLRINNRKKKKTKYNLQTWKEHIDELGKCQEVIKYFGRAITYENVKSSQPAKDNRSYS